MTAQADELKRRAAAEALDLVESGMALGLGTGSTVAHFLDLLGHALEEGDLHDVVGVPTSIRTGREARQAGIPLIGLHERAALDLAVDGADEVGPGLDLIKGMGGALLREKMVARAADRFVVIADDAKLVDRLGTRSPLPLEVVDWGFRSHVKLLESLGAEVSVRLVDDGHPLKSDNGNLLLDCRFADGLDDPAALDALLTGRPGVVATGLFLGMAHEGFVAGAEGVRRLGGDR